MRDIVDYENKYLNNNFEIAYQVKYRRKKVIELLRKYPHENILEIGCGMESLAAFIDDFKEYTIVDPSEVFIENAKEKLKNSKKKVSFITNSIEDASAKLMETKNFEVATAEVKIKVAPDCASSIQTKVIDGIKYILVPVGEGATVNGIDIDIKDNEL